MYVSILDFFYSSVVCSSNIYSYTQQKKNGFNIEFRSIPTFLTDSLLDAANFNGRTNTENVEQSFWKIPGVNSKRFEHQQQHELRKHYLKFRMKKKIIQCQMEHNHTCTLE